MFQLLILKSAAKESKEQSQVVREAPSLTSLPSVKNLNHAWSLDPFPKIFSETEGRNVLDACRIRGTGFRSSGPQSLILIQPSGWPLRAIAVRPSMSLRSIVVTPRSRMFICLRCAPTKRNAFFRPIAKNLFRNGGEQCFGCMPHARDRM